MSSLFRKMVGSIVNPRGGLKEIECLSVKTQMPIRETKKRLEVLSFVTGSETVMGSLIGSHGQ